MRTRCVRKRGRERWSGETSEKRRLAILRETLSNTHKTVEFWRERERETRGSRVTDAGGGRRAHWRAGFPARESLRRKSRARLHKGCGGERLSSHTHTRSLARVLCVSAQRVAQTARECSERGLCSPRRETRRVPLPREVQRSATSFSDSRDTSGLPRRVQAAETPAGASSTSSKPAIDPFFPSFVFFLLFPSLRENIKNQAPRARSRLAQSRARTWSLPQKNHRSIQVSFSPRNSVSFPVPGSDDRSFQRARDGLRRLSRNTLHRHKAQTPVSTTLTHQT